MNKYKLHAKREKKEFDVFVLNMAENVRIIQTIH